MLAELIEACRRIKTAENARTSTRGAKKSSAQAPKEDLTAVRARANENGIPVAARGRISESVEEQCAAAQKTVAAA